MNAEDGINKQDKIILNLIKRHNKAFFIIVNKIDKISQINMPKNSFEMASMLDIDKRAKKILLKSQSENDRLLVLKRILKKAIVKIDYNHSNSMEYSDYSQFEA